MKRALMIAAAGIVVFGVVGAFSHSSQQALISDAVISPRVSVSVAPSETASASLETLTPTPTPTATITPSPTATVVHTIAPTSIPHTATPVPTSTLSNDNYYQNVDGQTVHAPAYSNTKPAGASAQCRDGSYSFSTHRSGTCSGHGGVAVWY